MRSAEAAAVLVALAAVAAAFARRLRVPAPSLLVTVGLAVGLLPGAPVVRVPPAAAGLVVVVLPPLLYAASEREALATQGFGVLTGVDSSAPLLAKPGGHMGVCQPWRLQPGVRTRRAPAPRPGEAAAGARPTLAEQPSPSPWRQ